MKGFLRFLYIIQEVSNEQRYAKGLKRLGRGYFKAYRLNPYNPLSYITLILCLVIGIVFFGFYGIWKEIDKANPFKWD